jgi:hypothetical protein
MVEKVDFEARLQLGGLQFWALQMRDRWKRGNEQVKTFEVPSYC